MVNVHRKTPSNKESLEFSPLQSSVFCSLGQWHRNTRPLRTLSCQSSPSPLPPFPFVWFLRLYSSCALSCAVSVYCFRGCSSVSSSFSRPSSYALSSSLLLAPGGIAPTTALLRVSKQSAHTHTHLRRLCLSPSFSAECLSHSASVVIPLFFFLVFFPAPFFLRGNFYRWWVACLSAYTRPREFLRSSDPIDCHIFIHIYIYIHYFFPGSPCGCIPFLHFSTHAPKR